MHYKATAPSGKDFRTGTIDYAGALASGRPVHHPSTDSMVSNLPSTYLSTSTEPAETLIGGSWPCRLFLVEPVGEVLDGLDASPYKRACKSLLVVEELPAWQALGPNGEHVAALFDRIRSLTADELTRPTAAWYATRDNAALNAAWNAALNAALNAASNAAWDAAWHAAQPAAQPAAYAAARALLFRDKISTEHYRILTAHWSSTIGPVHPDDNEVTA